MVLKKYLILILAIPFITNAQQNTKNKVHDNISIGFSFSPDYNFRTLKNNNGASSSDMVIDIRDDTEKGKFGFTTGLNLNIKVSEKFKIQTGLLYSINGYRIPKQATYFPIPGPGQPTHFKANTSFNYLAIPLKLNFVSGNGKMRFIAGAGVSANFLLKESETVTAIYADGSEKKQEQSTNLEYKKFNLFSLISAGMEFKFKENIFLRTEPTFRYGLIKIIDQAVTAKLWNLGLNVGVCYKLK